MRKTLATLAILVLSSLTALGQPSLSPKRIVFNGDTGVFFIRTQEVALLQLIKQGEGLKKENVRLLDYQINCDKQIILERKAYDTLYTKFSEMTSLANEYKVKYEKEWSLHKETQNELDTQIGLTIKWKKRAIGLGVGNLILGGTIYLIITH
jgi:hypothetical protein